MEEDRLAGRQAVCQSLTETPQRAAPRLPLSRLILLLSHYSG